MVLFPEGLKALKDVAKEVGLDLRGAYFNLDGGFDSAHNRKCIFGTVQIPVDSVHATSGGRKMVITHEIHWIDHHRTPPEATP